MCGIFRLPPVFPRKITGNNVELHASHRASPRNRRSVFETMNCITHKIVDGRLSPPRGIMRACLILTFYFASLAAHAQMEQAEKLRLADGLYSREYYDLAIIEYAALLKENPTHPNADAIRYRMGECYLGSGNPARAEASYAIVFEKHRQSQFRFRAGFKLAELRLERGENELAISALQSLLQDNPPEDMAAACLYYLGDALRKTKKVDESAKTFEDLVNRYQSSDFVPPAMIMLGGIYAEKEDQIEKAISYYRRATEKPASDRLGAEAWFQLGQLYFRTGAYAESADAYGQLTTRYATDERVPIARLQYAWALHNSGRYSDSLERVKTELASSSQAGADTAEWLYIKANCERQLDQVDTAMQTYDLLLKAHKTAEFAKAARYEKGLILYKAGKHRETIELLKDYQPGPNLEKDVYWLLGEAYAALDEDDAATRCYRTLIERFPESELAAEAMYRSAFLLQKKSDFVNASGMYLEMVKKYPTYNSAAKALFASAHCLNSADKHADAVRDWTRLINEYATSPLVEESLYHAAMGRIFLKQDQEADDSLHSLLSRFPQTVFAADAHYWLGMILKEAGKNAEAETELRAALDLKPNEEMMMEARFHLALALQRQNKLDEAADLLQNLLASRASKAFPPTLLEWLAEYRYSQKKYEDATLAARLLAAEAQENAWQQIGWCIVGRCELADGHKGEAVEAYNKALAIPIASRFAAESALRLGELAQADGDFDAAQRYFQRAGELSSSDELLAVRASAYAGLARVFRALGKDDEASKHFMGVAILFDDPALVSECLYEAAQAFGRLGKENLRKKSLKELADRYPDSEWAKKAAAGE